MKGCAWILTLLATGHWLVYAIWPGPLWMSFATLWTVFSLVCTVGMLIIDKLPSTPNEPPPTERLRKLQR